MAKSGERAARVAIGLAVGLWLAGETEAANAAPAALRCMNTTSGATWDIPVDLADGTVDQVPAHVTDARISWEDKTMHFYDFDRRTGRLDMHVASSTGGFYLTDRCVLK